MFGNFPQLSCPVLDFVYKEVFCFVLFCFNYRFYFTCSDQSFQIIFLFLIHFWFVGIYLFIVFCYLFIYFWYIFCMLLLPLFLFLFYLGLSFLLHESGQRFVDFVYPFKEFAVVFLIFFLLFCECLIYFLFYLSFFSSFFCKP